ncbi:MAG: hypothetical protein JWP04_379 [Belnapia sp.]|nr:hypothetical protein [Belnapia sp.]
MRERNLPAATLEFSMSAVTPAPMVAAGDWSIPMVASSDRSTPMVATSDWSIVILARGEAASLARCLEAIATAAAGHDAQVTLLLNGGVDASVAVAERFAAGTEGGTRPRLRLFHIPHGDRANAWNHYLHSLRPAAAMHVFVDAHAAMTPGALRSLAATLAEHPEAEAATALPSTGRRAAAQRAVLRSGDALHGSLHALRGRFLDRIAQEGLRLPVGLREIHPVIAGLLGDRIVVAEEATWRVAPLARFSPKGLRRAWRRRIREARAPMEAAALTAALAATPEMPAFAAPMLRDWLTGGAARNGGVFGWLARQRLQREATPSYGDLLPRRLVLADVARSRPASGPRPAPAA